MKRITILFLLFFFFLEIHAQERILPSDSVITTSRFLEPEAGTYSIGSAYGIHPNWKNEEAAGYYFTEGNQSFRLKSLPLRLSYRLSNERYKAGQPSYFRLGFTNNQQFNKNKSALLNEKLALNKKKLAVCTDSIAGLEGKISFLQLKQLESKMDLPKLTVPDSLLPTLPDTTVSTKFRLKNPGISLPKTDSLGLSRPSTPSADSLQLASLGKLLDIQKLKKQALDEEQQLLGNQLDELSDQRGVSFLKGIKKVDIGLSTLSGGSLSTNRVPMQGLHIAGTVRRWFYDIASGVTLPNQLFSSQAFEQVLSNSNNVFNSGKFFNVQSTRFVSSVVVGYGDQGRNSIAVENFYNGRTLQEIRSGASDSRQLASNITGYYTPKSLPGLTLRGTVGTSFASHADTSGGQNLALGGGFKYQVVPVRGELTGSFRSIGKGYDAWSQGIYQNGTTQKELSYRQPLSRKAAIRLSAAENSFSRTTGRLKTTQGTLEGQWKCFKNGTFISSYTLLQLVGAGVEGSKISHLSRFTFTSDSEHKTFHLHKLLEGGYAQIAGADSAQRLVTFSGNLDMTLKKWKFGLKTTYTDFKGVNRLNGSSLIIAPEIAYKGPQVEAGMIYQQLISEQFGVKTGLKGFLKFRFDEYVSLAYEVQQWLPTDYTFFMPATPTGNVKPLYMCGRLIVDLKQKR